ncbi:MAG: acyltransferase [Candidatus Sulfotelmatobacter sp.]|jgi:peptidoglycan/LPS O-acetylase OafA/YrhL
MDSLIARQKTGALPSPGRLTFLDCVRGIAALSVLLEHGGYRLSPGFRGFTHGLFSFGKFGVAAFFLTSGFVIPLSLERGGSLKRFWLSRAFRLYPIYWLSIAVVLCLHRLNIPYAVSPEFALHLSRNALVNLTMLQGFVGFPNAEGLYYTLAMEMGFYIFFSVLYRLKLNHRSMPLAWLGCGGLTLCGTLVPLIFHKRVPLAGLFYLLCLLVGTALYRHFTAEARAGTIATLLGCVLLSTLVEVYCNYVLVKKDDALEHYTLGAVFLPWAGAYSLFLGAYVFRRHRFPGVLGWLGAVSYSVYLLHPLVASLVPVWPNRACSFLALLALTLAVAGATYRWVELPFISLGKRLQGRLETPALEPRRVWTKRVLSGMAARKAKDRQWA